MAAKSVCRLRDLRPLEIVERVGFVAAILANIRFDGIETCQGMGGLLFSALVQRHNLCPGGGMVDTGDLKSLGRKAVRVQVPPRVFCVVKRLSVLVHARVLH